VQEAAHPEANIIFGAVIDDALGDEVRVTVIAAGFDGGSPKKRSDEGALGQIQGGAPRQEQPREQVAPVRQEQPVADRAPGAESGGQPAPASRQEPVRQEVPREEQQRPEPQSPEQPPKQVTFDDEDDLNVPDFLR
ncbi:MAG: cell division protein FtsZ, partial [Intrasporangiaceae bacterium]|nr:cell division protein FtsZ [Intrasporangiaceae bacterium]